MHFIDVNKPTVASINRLKSTIGFRKQQAYHRSFITLLFEVGGIWGMRVDVRGCLCLQNNAFLLSVLAYSHMIQIQD